MGREDPDHRGGITTYTLKTEKPDPLYRRAVDTLEQKNLAKLTSKSSWYKGWKRQSGIEAKIRGPQGTIVIFALPGYLTVATDSLKVIALFLIIMMEKSFL